MHKRSFYFPNSLWRGQNLFLQWKKKWKFLSAGIDGAAACTMLLVAVNFRRLREFWKWPRLLGTFEGTVKFVKRAHQGERSVNCDHKGFDMRIMHEVIRFGSPASCSGSNMYFVIWRYSCYLLLNSLTLIWYNLEDRNIIHVNCIIYALFVQ